MSSVRSLVAHRGETQLVAAARRGDDRAFEEIYARYQSRIHSFVLSRVRDHGRAEDIVQEVFLSALRQLRASDREIAFRPWLYTIARNACIDESRRGARRREVPVESDDDLGGEAGHALLSAVPTPPAAIESKRQIADLTGAFGDLPERQHRLLVMRELEGLSYDEIGERLGMTRAMVESGLFRARRRLGEEYAELRSGRRCQQIQTAIGAGRLGRARGLGIKERRRCARHLAYCQPCRQQALAAHVDASLLAVPRNVPAQVAAWLPLPLLVRWPGRRAATTGGHHAGLSGAAGSTASGGASAGGAVGGTATVAGGAAAGASAGASAVGIGQAAAVAALALAGAGGGYLALEHHSAHVRPAVRAALADASASPAGAGRVDGSARRGGRASGRVRAGAGAGKRHARAGAAGRRARADARRRRSGAGALGSPARVGPGRRTSRLSGRTLVSGPGTGTSGGSHAPGGPGGTASSSAPVTASPGGPTSASNAATHGSGSGTVTRGSPTPTVTLPSPTVSAPTLPTGNPVASAPGTVGGTVGTVGSGAAGTVGGAAGTVGGTVGTVGSGAAGTVGGAAGTVGGTVGTVGSGAAGTVGGTVGTVGGTVGTGATTTTTGSASSPVPSNPVTGAAGGTVSTVGGVVSGVGGGLGGP